MKVDPCDIRRKLEDTIIHAIDQKYKAKVADANASITQTKSDLSGASKAEYDALVELRDHAEKHGCKVSGP